jgi:hypothetical protein
VTVPLASEVTTWEERNAETTDGNSSSRLRSRVRTNARPERFKKRLEMLGLLAFAESIERYETNWHWSGTGQGYEILWRDETTFTDLLPLARL